MLPEKFRLFREGERGQVKRFAFRIRHNAFHVGNPQRTKQLRNPICLFANNQIRPNPRRRKRDKTRRNVQNGIPITDKKIFLGFDSGIHFLQQVPLQKNIPDPRAKDSRILQSNAGKEFPF